MSLRIYNTRTKKKEPFPLDEKRIVKVYICGPTVYDYCHLGHARTYVVFDVIRRYLDFKGHEVKHVQNFTDVAEEISKKAFKLKVKASELAESYTREYFKDMDSLNVKRADAYPKVSEHIPDIIETIERFFEKRLAYEMEGEVYFDTSKSGGYGILSGVPPEELTKSVKYETQKRSLLDFALWKKSKEFEDEWDSPWGKGRPGWHAECYTMASKHLGLPLDLHGGGLDLIFPHHESARIMAESYDKKEFANVYVHNGFITMSSEKMSKSTGLFVALRPLIERFGWKILRFYLIKTHYRENIEYNEERLELASDELREILETIDKLKGRAKNKKSSVKKGIKAIQEYEKEFFEAMDDDFDTSKAVETILSFARWAKDRGKDVESDVVIEKLESFLNVLGF